MLSRLLVVALLLSAAFGTVYAFAFGGAPAAAGRAKSACGCEVCKCPDCNGEFCSCDSCECIGCGCVTESAAKSGTQNALPSTKGCCATEASATARAKSDAKVSQVKSGCGCVVCKCPDCNGEFCTCEACECVGCGCAI